MEYIIGIDEVGLGCFAGPCVVGAVLAPKDWAIDGLNDSKKIKKHKDRSAIYDKIQEQSPFIQWVLEWRTSQQIDERGLGRAHRDAIESAAKALLEKCPEAEVVIDGVLQFRNFPHRSVPKADSLFPAVMAASILAKVERDRWMHTEADSLYPEYDFISNVGYHSVKHMEALDKYGPCKIHRVSFAPIARRMLSRA